jgi:hypothetical protein
LLLRRRGSGASAAATLVAALLLVGGGLVPNVHAQGPDRSDVVLVLDFSASILEDVTNRNRFGAALERIAARVDETSADLVAGDATVTIVQFATKAADYPNCADLKLLGSPETVARFAGCLRSVAAAYRKGVRVSLTQKIGIDTNYVAAMEQAAVHLPVGAVRPALILFTDGKHDVAGVPVSEVPIALQRLFGARSPFALLPVGMGLDPTKRDALASGLESLRVIRAMPACATGAVFVWPQVVFETADQAGNAVAVALQDATCTFTVAPTPTPKPVPTPAPVKGIRLTPGDGVIDVAWAPLAASPAPQPIVDYTVRCRTGDGDWIESKEGVSLVPTTTVDGLVNGKTYQCEVAAIGPSGAGPWTAASTPVTPIGRPAAPGKPSVQSLDHAVQVTVTPDDAANLTGYRYECSGDNGATWPAAIDVSAESTTAEIDNLTNGVDYRCRAFAENATGVSDASLVSDAVRPCGSALECNPVLLPALGGIVLLMVAGILAALFALYRGRTQGYVVAVVDIVHTANIGHGSTLGIGFERDPDTRVVTGIVADRSRKADIRIIRLRDGRFAVRDRMGRREATDGDAIVVADSVGARHSLVLRAFDTNAASEVASRR